MYLPILNEEQKQLFLNIAEKIACADGNFSKEEKQVIDGYCHEMSVVDIKKFDVTMEDLIDKLNSISDTKEKKIIVFEVIGLAMVDSNFDESERMILKNMVNRFDLDLGYIDKCENVIQRYMDFQNEINSLVIG